jgi:nicotinate phosphoribosyltransferase
MIGVRLDSGDLAWLSREARRILDEGGFPRAQVLASNDLDETLIAELKRQGAAIDVWGVGTRLVTAFGDPALGGVYKLTAVREKDGEWQDRVKVSEQSVKTTNPGIQQVRRFRLGGELIGDAIYDVRHGLPAEPTIVDPMDLTRRKVIPAGAELEDLLVPVFRNGDRVYAPPGLAAIRGRVREQLAGLHAGVKRFINPHRYPAGLELGYFERKTRLVLEARGLSGGASREKEG